MDTMTTTQHPTVAPHGRLTGSDPEPLEPGGRAWGGRSGVGAEVARVLAAARRRLAERGLAGLALTGLAAALIGLFAVARPLSPGVGRAIDQVSAVSARVPVGTVLLRLPLSIVAPTPSLPAWGSVLQVLVMFGLAELLLGRRRLVAMALVVQAATTLAVRVALWAGPHAYLGLRHRELLWRDTGPSAVVMALAAVLAARLGLRRIGAALVVFVALDATLVGHLASREHALALAIGFGWGGALRRLDRAAPVVALRCQLRGRVGGAVLITTAAVAVAVVGVAADALSAPVALVLLAGGLVVAGAVRRGDALTATLVALGTWAAVTATVADAHDRLGVAAAVLTVGLTRPRWARHSDRATAVARSAALDHVRRHGTDSLAWFALRDDKRWFLAAGCAVPWAPFGSVALVAPDPIGPAEHRADAMAAFVAFARGHGLRVAVLGAAESRLADYRRLGLHTVYVGDEAVVDSRTFRLDGGDRKGLRQAANRAAAKGYTVSFHSPAGMTPGLRAAVEGLAPASRRGGAERGFSMTLGRTCDPGDPDLLVAVCHAPDGRPVAFCQFVPAPGLPGWSLDLMRREREGGHPNGLLDFVLVETIRHEAATRGGVVTLNFTVLRQALADTSPSRRRRALRAGLHAASASVQIETLWRFNEKYGPTWQGRWVAFESWLDVPAVAWACGRAEGVSELPVVGRWLAPRPVARTGAIPTDGDVVGALWDPAAVAS